MTSNVFKFPGGGKGSLAGGRRLIPSRLRDARLACRLNQSELAAAIDVSRQAISAFEQGEKSPEATTMAKIAETLRQPVSFFVSDDPPSFGESSPTFFRAFGADTKRRNLMCEVLGKWSAQTSKYIDNFVSFPVLDIPYASPSSPSGRYTEEEIEVAAEQCRRAWGLGIGPISNVVNLLEGRGINIFRLEVPEEKINAFSFWNGSKAFIFMASDTSSAVRARFDIAHELGHLILHRGVGPDELEDSKKLKLIEAEANRFAGAFLLPRKSFPTEVFTTRLDAFVSLKSRWKVAVQAMVYRCKDLGIFDESQVTNLYKQISFKKWRTNEPLDDKIAMEKPRLMMRAIELLIEAGQKSAEEILLESRISPAFLSDITGIKFGQLEVAYIGDVTPILR